MKIIIKIINTSKKVLHFIKTTLYIPINIPLVIEQNKFLLYEIRKLNKLLRLNAVEDTAINNRDMMDQTCSSFDYQWEHLTYGIAMPQDNDFMRNIEELICTYTGIPQQWFEVKRILDVGCGSGRFSYGFLKLGAQVCSVDQSEWAVKKTEQLCKEFSEKHICFQKNILTWKDTEAYDLVFCFGVVHHTGNTYQAIINTANKVKNDGGKLFLMVYGFPETYSDFRELNLYEKLRNELRNLSFDEKKQTLLDQFGTYKAHGFFDAVSPKINDLLTFTEVKELLQNLGFIHIHRTISNRNLFIIAEKGKIL